MQALVGLIDLKIEFNCIALKLPVRLAVWMWLYHKNEDLKEERTVQSMLLKYFKLITIFYI
jgi:hypothetical protein